MAKYLVEDTSLINIADAIRNKTGDTAKLSLLGMADSVAGLVCGDDTETIAKLNALIDRSIADIRSDIENIGDYALCACKQLTTADFPIATSIGVSAFNSCSSLTTIYFPIATSIGRNSFSDCKQLKTADFPSATSIDESAFNGCSRLTTADFPSATSIGGYVFRDCSSLTTADFPSATSIGGYAFRGCSSLTTADFPSAISLSNYAFLDCAELTTADFPVATSIGAGAFAGCSKFNALSLRSKILCSLSNSNAFARTPIISGTGYIYVPSSLVDIYKSATNWSTYATQFRALEDYTVDGTITGELDAEKVGA